MLVFPGLDPKHQVYVDRLLALSEDADKDDNRLVANGALALVSALHMTYEEQRTIALLFHDVVDLVRTCHAFRTRSQPHQQAAG